MADSLASSSTGGSRFPLRNAALNWLGEGTWGLYSALFAFTSVMPVLLARFGAGKVQIASLTSIEGFAGVLPPLVGVYLFASRKRRKAMLLLGHALGAVPLILAAAIVLWQEAALGPVAARWLLWTCCGGSVVVLGTFGPAWTDWIAHLFDTRIRGTIVGVGFFALAGCGAVGMLLAGWFLGKDSPTRSYMWLFLVAVAAGWLSMVFFSFVRDPASQSDEPDTRRLPTAQLLRRFLLSLSESNFRRYLTGRVLATLGFAVTALIAVHYRSPAGGQVRDSWIISCEAARLAGVALASLLIGRLGDRRGHLLGAVFGAGAQAVTLLIVILVPGPWGCAAAMMGVGVCFGANFVSHFNMLLETCPHDHRMAHITLGNLVLSPFGIVAPLLAGFAAESMGTIRPVFVASLVLSLAAMVWVWAAVKEPRTLAVYAGD